MRVKSLLALAAMAAWTGAMASTYQNEEQTEAALDRAEPRGPRTVRIVEDRDQTYMASKVYELKHIRAAELTPFIQGAIYRRHQASRLDRINYSAGNKQFIVVHTAHSFIPYVDEMIERLDRPSNTGGGGEPAALVDGDGLYRYVYEPRHRYSADMLTLVRSIQGGGNYFTDASTNMFYWTSGKGKGDGALKWFQALDRPLPQVDLTMKVYEVNDNNMKELGIDYISWKNGPGLEIFGFGAEMFNLQANEQFFANASSWISKMGGGWTGMMFAPQFDASFIRMLNQRGKANVYTSGSITMVNALDGDDSYIIELAPGFQNISKTNEMQVSVDQPAALAANNDNLFRLVITEPVIAFGDEGETAGAVMFEYQLSGRELVERNNFGTAVVNNREINSNLTLACNVEKLVGSFSREHHVNQYNGMPFLGDIPVLKYFVGSTSDSKSLSRMVVTLEATPVLPTSRVSDRVADIMAAAESMRENK